VSAERGPSGYRIRDSASPILPASGTAGPAGVGTAKTRSRFTGCGSP